MKTKKEKRDKFSLLKKVVIFFIIIFLSVFFLLKTKEEQEPLSVVSIAHDFTPYGSPEEQDLTGGNRIVGSFRAGFNNLGIVAMRFNTHNRISNDELLFKIKERTSASWHYQNIYKADLIPHEKLFPFGFPPLPDSEKKEYIFELTSLKGIAGSRVALSSKKPNLVSKYQFAPASLLANRQLPRFLYHKFFGGLNFTSLIKHVSLAVLFIVFAFAHHKFFKNKIIKDWKLHLPIIVLGSFLLAFFLVGANFRAQLGIIDDHWIMHFLGPDKKVTLPEIPRLILSTEVGQFGNYERFRPAYYPILITESLLWGANPFLWYLSRFFLFAASIGITWYILSRFWGLFLGFLTTLFILTYGYWADIWTRLIPGEIFAVFGTCLFALGFCGIVFFDKKNNNKREKGRVEIMVVAIGYIIAAGSKENLLILTIPLLYLFIRGKKIRQDIFNRVTLLLLLVWGGLIAAAISLATLKSGQDVYLREADFGGRFQLLGPGLRLFIERFKIVYVTAGFFILSFIVFAKRGSKKIEEVIKIAHSYFFWLIVSALFFVSQYMFYAGQWPQNNRYDFPGLLVSPFLLFFITLTYYKVIRLFYKVPFSSATLKTILAGTLILLILTKGFGIIQERSLENAKRTNEFHQSFEKLTKLMKNNPEGVVFIESYSMWDYEPIFSLQRYLRNSGYSPAYFLKIYDYTKKSGNNRLEKQLSATLYTYSEEGSKADFQFDPLHLYNKTRNCISVIFSKIKKGDGECEKVVLFRTYQ